MADALKYSDSGKSDLPLLVFIHGWPDTGELWKKQVAHFSKNYRCICITLPAFGEADPSSGFDFPELADRIAATIEEARADADVSVTVVGHDWGAFLTYLLDQRHPMLAKRLITMDVGAHIAPSSVGHALFMVSYQWYLVAALLVGRAAPPLGDAMTRGFARLAGAPRRDDVQAKANYPYFYFWRARLFGKYADALPKRYRPTKPLLYLYGMKKKYHFHSPKWEEIVTRTPGSEVVGLAKADHWLMVRDPEGTNAAMERWLEKTNNA